MYRWAEFLCLGTLLQRTREHFLRDVAGTRHALVLGDGDGRFLARLLERSPSTSAMAVDTSAAMLSLLGDRCRFASERLTTLRADFTALPRNLDLSGTDLVVAHFALDCLSQGDLDRLAGSLAERLRPGALWVVSDFALPPDQPWHTLARVYLRLLYLAFRLLTGLRTQRLPDVQGSLGRNGFSRIRRAQWLKGLLYTEIWQLRSTPGPRETSARAQLHLPVSHPPLL